MQTRSMMPLRCGCAALGSAAVITQTASGVCTGADVAAGAISGTLMVARGACSTRKAYTTGQPLDVPAAGAQSRNRPWQIPRPGI